MSNNSQSHEPSLQEVLNDLAKLTDPSQLLTGISNNPQTVFAAFQNLTQSYESLKSTTAELDAYKKRVKELEEQTVTPSNSEPTQTNEVLNRLAQLLQPRSVSKTVLLTDGEVFSGKKEDYYTWKESILLKLNSNSDYFPTEQSRLAHIFSQMGTASKTHLNSWIKDGEILFSSVQQMFSVVDTLFGDPNRVRDAVNRLHSNYQRKKPFAEWIVEIRRDASIAGYMSDSKPLCDLIFYNMSIELKKALVHERDIDELDLDKAIARLQDIDNRQRAIAALVSKSGERRNLFNQQPRDHHFSSTWSNNAQQAGEPMDLSASRFQRRGPLSQEEKERRRRLKLCLYCGEPGHFAQGCPVKTHKNSLRGNSAIHMEDDGLNDSGKEQAL